MYFVFAVAQKVKLTLLITVMNIKRGKCCERVIAFYLFFCLSTGRTVTYIQLQLVKRARFSSQLKSLIGFLTVIPTKREHVSQRIIENI